MTRVLFRGLFLAWIAALLLPATAQTTTSIRWAKNADTLVCATDPKGKGECEVAVAQSQNRDLVRIRRINAGLHHPVQWIEVRQDSYALCAFNSYRETKCEGLSSRRTPGSWLSAQEVRGHGTILRLSFPSTIEKKARQSLGQAFAASFIAARATLAKAHRVGLVTRTQFLLSDNPPAVVRVKTTV